MWIELQFGGGVLSIVYYNIIPNINVPEGTDMEGLDAGLIVFATNQLLSQKNIDTIINAIDDRHDDSRNYLPIAINHDLRREEFIPDVMLRISRGRFHSAEQGWQAFPNINNDAEMMKNLFRENRRVLTAVVVGLLDELGEDTELYDVKIREDGET